MSVIPEPQKHRQYGNKNTQKNLDGGLQSILMKNKKVILNSLKRCVSNQISGEMVSHEPLAQLHSVIRVSDQSSASILQTIPWDAVRHQFDSASGIKYIKYIYIDEIIDVFAGLYKVDQLPVWRKGYISIIIIIS